MITISGTNVNDVFTSAMLMLRAEGEESDSRVGRVKSYPYPVASTYFVPTQRVLYNKFRNANPYFHLMESLWMLAGHNDLAWPLQFNSQFKAYSDDGEKLKGAYGHRWRQHFGHDQIEWVIDHLTDYPNSRRACITMFDPREDQPITNNAADIPCNTNIYFRVRGSRLDMTVCCRSNDAIWGAYGANAVHMSFLQEYVALALGLWPGIYTQLSNNLHIYEHHFDLLTGANYFCDDLYTEGRVRPWVLWDEGIDETREQFDRDVKMFLANPGRALPETLFMRHIAHNMYLAYMDRKSGGDGTTYTKLMPKDCDWYVATEYWREAHEDKQRTDAA